MGRGEAEDRVGGVGRKEGRGAGDTFIKMTFFNKKIRKTEKGDLNHPK